MDRLVPLLICAISEPPAEIMSQKGIVCLWRDIMGRNDAQKSLVGPHGIEAKEGEAPGS